MPEIALGSAFFSTTAKLKEKYGFYCEEKELGRMKQGQ